MHFPLLDRDHAVEGGDGFRRSRGGREGSAVTFVWNPAWTEGLNEPTDDDGAWKETLERFRRWPQGIRDGPS